MAANALNIPDAVDVDVLAIKPAREFEVCNHLLDDHAALERFYEDNGYLFFRGVLNPDSVSRARDEMLAIAADHFGLVEKGDASARWTAIDAGLLARAPLTSWLALRGRVDGLVPLERPTFEVENEGVVHKPPPFGIRAALGVELNFL